MHRCVVIFVILAVFGLIGNFAFAQEEANSRTPQEEITQKGADINNAGLDELQKELKSTTAQKRQIKKAIKKAKLDQLTKTLNLTASQRKQISAIMDRVSEDTRQLSIEFQRRNKEIKDRGRDEIMDLLTQEQRIKFQALNKNPANIERVGEQTEQNTDTNESP